MAFLFGHITDAELEKLRAAGWRDLDPPSGYRGPGATGKSMRVFFVGHSLFEVMATTGLEAPDYGPDDEEQDITWFFRSVKERDREFNKLLQNKYLSNDQPE